MDIQALIEKHNLSIRRIPMEVQSLWSAHNVKEGDEIVEVNGRQFVRTVKIPDHAGWYMVKQVNNTDSMVRWSYKTDNLAPTLQESIELFLSKL